MEANRLHGAFLACRDGVVVDVDAAAGEWFGCPAQDLLGRPLAELVPPDERATLAQRIAEHDGAAASFAGHLLSPLLSEPLAAEFTVFHVDRRQGERAAAAGAGPAAAACVVRDVQACTASAKQLARLADAQRRVAAMLELSLEDLEIGELLQRALDLVLSIPWLSIERKGAIFTVDDGDPPQLVMRASRGLSAALSRMCRQVPFGTCLCGAAALTGQALHTASLDHRHSTRYEGMAEHGHYAVPIRRGAVTEGVLCTYLQTGHPCSDEELEFLSAMANALAGVLVHRRAESERERIRGRLAEAQRVEAIAQMAAGAAHDFGNILGIVQSAGQLLHGSTALDDPGRRAVEALLRASARGAELTRKLLAVGRTEARPAEPLNLDEALREFEPTLHRVVGDPVAVRIEAAAAGARIALAPTDLERVLVNLAANARDAMPSGGTLTLRTRHAPGRHVVIEVEDTGAGMAPEVQARLFEPFFTTKPREKGTGLGMPTVLSIIRAAGGDISLESKEGHGTVLRLQFAIAGPTLRDERAAGVPPAVPTRTPNG